MGGELPLGHRVAAYSTLVIVITSSSNFPSPHLSLKDHRSGRAVFGFPPNRIPNPHSSARRDTARASIGHCPPDTSGEFAGLN
jgi:hypothetical protein